MRIRVKYTKTGPLRYISHLDLMRYFQKAINRAGLDIAYSTGMSPHQIISFAAPMPVMMTSEGEYFDAEFNSVTTASDMVRRFNETASPFALMKDIVILPDDAVNSMAAVTASDYVVTFTKSKSNEKEIESKNSDNPDKVFTENCVANSIIDRVDSVKEIDSIEIVKKTKKSEKVVNIRPLIYDIKAIDDDKIYMLLATGSKDNLKAELVMEALYSMAGIPYNRFDFNLHRLETYMTDEKGDFKSLLSAGKSF